MRIAKALALAGIDSRRKCETHIRNGAVTVNGETVFDLGRQVNPQIDAIAFRGRMLHFHKSIYYMMNKPVGYTTTASDVHAKKTVFDLLPKNLIQGSRQPKPGVMRVFPVGRLDKNSTGLLLFTNDGDLANKLTHPRYGVAKWYDVRLDRGLEARDAKKLTTGIRLREGLAKAESLKKLTRRIVRLCIREGKKREIRRMFEVIHYEVIDLMRISFGPLELGRLPVGHGRFLTEVEIKKLKQEVKTHAR